MDWIPHDYQATAVQDIINNPYRQLWFLPGDGKTSCVLDAFVKLKLKGEASKLLVIAPLVAVYDTWPKEIEKWDQFKHLKFSIIHGKNRQNALESDADVYLINFECLRWLLNCNKKNPESSTVSYSVLNFLKLGIDMLVIDELSKCKSVSTAQSKCIKMLSRYVPKRIGLTGTPAANNLMGVFGQALVIDGGATFGKSVHAFRNTYFNKAYYEFEWKLNVGADKEIQKLLSNSVTQRAHSNKGDLKFNPIEMTFDLPDDAMALYRGVEKDFIEGFDGKNANSVNAASKTIRLRQIASGFFYHENLTEEEKDENLDAFLLGEAISNKQINAVKNVHLKKAEIIKHLIEELNGHPLLIFYQFVPEIEMIGSVYGKKIPLLTTKSLTEEKELINDWNAGKIPVMMAHPKSMSYSANLQMSGAHVCFSSPEIDNELFTQAVQRVYRQGNPNHETRCYHILANNTYDPYAVQRLGEKSEVQSSLINGVMSYIKNNSI